MTTPHSNPHHADPSRFTLWFIFMLGNACLAATLITCYFTATHLGIPPAKLFAQTGQLMVAHIFGGRIFNAGVGVQMNLPDWFVVFQCWIYDLILMCYGYPLFALGFKRFAHWPIVGPHLETAHKTALAHSDTVRPYGLTGLLIFVVIPTGGMGPMAGAILGYVLGLGTASIFIVLGAADLLWTIVFVALYAKLADYSPVLAMTFLIVVVAVIVGGIALRLWRGLRSIASGNTPPPDGKE